MTITLTDPAETPARVSVIIPVLDAEATLARQLRLLANETLTMPWEVIIADNGSRDASALIATSFAGEFPDFTFVDASDRRGPAHARNRGADAASGDLLCFCDADDEIETGWLTSIVAAAAGHHFVAGRLDIDAINSANVRASRPTPLTAGPSAPPFAPSGNLAVWADAFRAAGGFDETLLANEDAELSQRLLDAGATMAWAPDAIVHYRYRRTTSGVLRQSFRSAWFEVHMRARRNEQLITRATIIRQLSWLITRLPYVVTRGRRTLWLRWAGSLGGEAGAALWLRVRRDHRGASAPDDERERTTSR